MRSLTVWILLALTAAVLTGCGGKDTDRTETDSRQKDQPDISIKDGDAEINIDLDDLEENLRDAMAGKNEGQGTEVVDFRELKALLPEKVGSFKRTSSSGEKTGMMGFNFSNAEAEYEDGDKSMEVTITDAGGISVLITSFAAWTMMEMDRETDEGYERTTTIQGYKAFEQFNKRTGEAEISLLVGDRFIVSFDGRNLAEKDVERFLDAINLKKLERLD